MNNDGKQNTAPAQPTDVCMVIAVLPGQTEAWRRFVQELQGPQHQAWAAWRRRVGLAQLQIRLQTTSHRAVAVLQTRFHRTDGWPQSLVDDQKPFDRWLREQILTLHGLDLAQLWTDGQQEFIADIETVEKDGMAQHDDQRWDRYFA